LLDISIDEIKAE